MYAIIEFSESASGGGGLAVVDNNWLTPRKKHCFWPPYKSINQFNKCLAGHESPKDNWELFDISRCFYETSDIDKARKKVRDAEETSDLQSEIEDRVNRKRKVPKHLIYSSSEDEIKESVNKRPPTFKSAPVNSSQPLRTTFQNSEHCTTPVKAHIQQHTKHASVGLPEIDNSLPAGTSTPVSFNLNPNTNTPRGLLNIDKPAQDKIIELLVHIKEQNRQILEAFKKPKQDLVVQVLELPIKIPLTSFEEITQLEDILGNDTEASKLFNFLVSVGGKDVKSKTNKILKTILTDDLAKNYSFYGKRSGKRAFSNLKLCDVITKAAKHNTGATNNDVQDSMKVWLKHAPERLKKKEQKTV